MRILHVINTLEIGGAEKLVTDLIPVLNQKKNYTQVLILKKTKTFFLQKLKEETVHSLSSGSLYNFFLIFKIIPYLRKFDIIHVHLFPSLYWVVFAKIISFSKVKIVYTEHNTENRRREHFILKYIDRFVYYFLDFVICITKATEYNLKKHLKGITNTKVINNGIKIQQYQNIHQSLDLFNENKTIVLIQISSFREQKDQQTLIRCMKNLPEIYKLLLVGEGNLKNDCIELTKQLSLQNRVNFLGKRDDIPELLNYSQIVVQSSNYEGFGLAALEGMAAGKPVVASNVEGLKEIVKGYGLLFNVKDQDDLAKNILKLGSDPNYYSKVANRCFQRSLDFSLEKMAEQYLEIYKFVNG